MRKVFIAPLAASALFFFSGCSLVGFGLGSRADSSRPDEYLFTPSGLDSIKSGATIEVTKRDSSVTVGQFERLAHTPSAEYTARCNQAMLALSNGTKMPALSDSVKIVTHDLHGRRAFSGRLVGFGSGVVWLASESRLVGLHVEAIDTLWKSTAVLVDGNTVRRHLNKGEIPFMPSALVVTTREGTKAISVDDILKVRQPVTKYGKWWGLAVGAVVDVGVYFYIASKIDFPPRSGELNLGGH